MLEVMDPNIKNVSLNLRMVPREHTQLKLQWLLLQIDDLSLYT